MCVMPDSTASHAASESLRTSFHTVCLTSAPGGRAVPAQADEVQRAALTQINGKGRSHGVEKTAPHRITRSPRRMALNRIIAAVLKGAGLCLAVSIAAAVRAGAQDGDSIY